MFYTSQTVVIFPDFFHQWYVIMTLRTLGRKYEVDYDYGWLIIT